VSVINQFLLHATARHDMLARDDMLARKRMILEILTSVPGDTSVGAAHPS